MLCTEIKYNEMYWSPIIMELLEKTEEILHDYQSWDIIKKYSRIYFLKIYKLDSIKKKSY